MSCTISAPWIIPGCNGGICEGGSWNFGASLYSSMTQKLNYSALFFIINLRLSTPEEDWPPFSVDGNKPHVV